MEVVRRVKVDSLPNQIREARQKDHRSVQLLATLANISTTYWYQLEAGKRSWVSEEVIRRIEKVLDTDFNVKFD
ncbi:MAG: helix-turn-helix domain-containing protein [Xenococcus sp. (in: cyanobacteria)]